MQKGLLKIIIALFLLSVIDPASVCDESHLPVSQQQHELLCKIHENALLSVRIVHQGPVIEFKTYGALKPLWTGGHDMHGELFTVSHLTLLKLTNLSTIHSLQFFKQLLYPFHFFR